MKVKKIAGVCLLLLAFPTAALANTGSAMMIASALHLLVGNALIGLLEGLLMGLIFKLRKWSTILVLIGANYFSAWIGYYLLTEVVPKEHPSLDIYNFFFFFWIWIIASYVITLILEFPFVAFVLRRKEHWLKKAIVGSLIIQTASYVLLAGWYGYVTSGFQTLRNQIVPASEISLPEAVLFYYISSDDGDVYEKTSVSADSRKVFDLNSTNRQDRLYMRASLSQTNKWDVIARLDEGYQRDPKHVPVQESRVLEAVPKWDDEIDRAQFNTPYIFWKVPRLGIAETSPWNFRCDFWPGFGGRLSGTDITVGFSFETPFVRWGVRNCTHLPGDNVLLQLGDDQICVFDPTSNRLALVARGRGPVAVLVQGLTTNKPSDTETRP